MSSSGSNATPVPVRTTFPHTPLPPLSQREAIRTKHLLLRPLTQFDLQPYHGLRKQPKFMAETSLGRADRDINDTKTALDELTDPANEHFIFGIFDAATGELIGEGGIHSVHGSTGWPEIGYKIAPEHWGHGYATEAMSAVLQAWWALPRQAKPLMAHVHPDTIALGKAPVGEDETDDGEGAPCRELVVAEIATYNAGSRRVLEKLGFEHFGTWEEPDSQLHRLGQTIMIGHYALAKPDATG